MLTPSKARKPGRQLLVAALACGVGAASAAGADASSGEIDLSDLGKFDLETLLTLEVTSASKKEEKLSHSATAIYVITQEDIRRSGLTTLPELFRMVPGMQVARVNGGQWAISSRGFNDPYSDKLLVLVDGRTIYTPSFGGVVWVDQDLALEDLDRVEVIRGPGATLWGANAVNGVINVITKRAKDTHGLLLSTTYGTLEQPSTTLRYGGKLAENLHYRVFGKYFNHADLETSQGQTLGDDWRIGSGGLRLDWEPSETDLFTLQGGYFNGRVGEIRQQPQLTPPYTSFQTVDNHNSGGHLLGRWIHAISEGSEFSIQAFFDRNTHREFGITVRQDTYDFELQHRFQAGSRNEITWGAGYRYLPDELSPSATLDWADYKTDHQLVSGFAQDELTIIEDQLRFTAGMKLEHNDYTGLELQPSGRLLYTPTEKQSIWASVSRAVRMPTRADIGFRGNLRAFPTGPDTPPMVVRTRGNPDFDAEEVIAYELGYRVRPHKLFSIDAAGFYNVHHGLRRFVQGEPFFEPEPFPPHLVTETVAQNGFSGVTYGAELSTEWAPLEYLRFHAGYSWLEYDIDPENSPARGNPEQQFHLRAYLDLPHSVQLMGAAYWVDQIAPANGVANIPLKDYLRVDLGISWRPTESLEIGLWGQNLLDPAHPEYTSYRSPNIAEIPRSVVGKITYTF